MELRINSFVSIDADQNTGERGQYTGKRGNIISLNKKTGTAEVKFMPSGEIETFPLERISPLFFQGPVDMNIDAACWD